MNIFQRILETGNDEDFEPTPGPMHLPTKSSPGSSAKIEVLRKRIELGLPLWHERDEKICSVVVRAQIARSKVVSGRGKSEFA